MDDYSKSIPLDVKISLDSESELKLNEIKSTMLAGIKANEVSLDQASEIYDSLENALKSAQLIAKFNKDLAIISNLKSPEANMLRKTLSSEVHRLGGLTEDDKKRLQRQQNLQAGFVSALAAIGKSFLDRAKDIVEGALDRLKDMSSYSRLSQSDTRNLRLKYGLGASEAYGLTEAMSMLGLSSVEDIWWMNDVESNQFYRLVKKYTDYYEKTMTPEYVEKQLEYQIAMKEFKTDLEHSVIEFFMDNKDTIYSLMQFSMDYMKHVMSVLDVVSGFFGGRRSDAEVSREIEQLWQNISTNNTSVNQTNHFTNVTSADQAWYQNQSAIAYKQLTEVYKGA